MTPAAGRLPLVVAACLVLAGCASTGGRLFDPLPSWNDGAARRAILDFVAAATDPEDPGFVPEAERIAVFDNDATPWAEQPVYFQVFFVLDRIDELAPQHPEWQHKEPFRSAIARDLGGIAASGQRGLMDLLTATHADLSTDEFRAAVTAWIETARHPQTGRPFTSMVYQPMLEMLRYLEAEGFRVFIVSGGGQDFMRPWAEAVYGIPPERVIGSHLQLDYQARQDGPVLMKRPAIALLNDEAGKPIAIHRFIGRRPVLAFGNSDGDFEMLEWTTAVGPSLGVLVHHTDAGREWAYDRSSPVGRLERGLAEAGRRGWVVVDMAADWSRVFAD